MNILIGADIVPTNSNMGEFEKGSVRDIVGVELLNLLSSVDYRVFNLEVPLVDVQRPIKKCGPNLIASTKSVQGIKALGVDFLTLANNHILDQGPEGIKSTERVLKEQGISYAGVGSTQQAAATPYIFEKEGVKIGIYCCAEHEFSIVSPQQPGANPFDPLESLDHVRELKKIVDYVIVLYHGGKEHYRYPSPYLQKVCRKIVESGADFVVCQHSHCIGCEEKWNGGTIVYGQGNFLFDDSESEFWQTSLLIQLCFENGAVSVRYIPIEKNGNGVKLASDASRKRIMDDFHLRSAEIQTPSFVADQYAEFAEMFINNYIRSGVPFGQSIIARILNKLSKNTFFVNCVSDSGKLALINYMECEAHRELYLQGIRNHLKNK